MDQSGDFLYESTVGGEVSSWNEWDPLEEIVIGIADGAVFEPTEPGSKPKCRGAMEHLPFPTGPKPSIMVEGANLELDNLARVLVELGVIVRRPDKFDYSRPVQTPHFTVPVQYCGVCPRDVVITVGPQIIEATMSRRARFFEYTSYRGLIYKYWLNNPGVVWTVAPKPSMDDRMYRDEFWALSLGERYKRMHDFEFCITQDEVVFDAADAVRFGRDIFVQESMTTNRLGISWLKRELEPRGFRVSPLHFPLDLFPSHIDCTFVPLRPGLILTNPERPLAPDDRYIFELNGWNLIDAPQPSFTNDQMPSYCQSSKWLSMNVLSVSPKVVICEEQETALHNRLRELAFEVITVPFRNVYEFGGSLHCATWDIRRSGNCHDYFPDQNKSDGKP